MSEQVLTARGARTRARIVEATADLVLTRGARATTLDDIRAATNTSRSQLFHYFPGGKAELIRAVAVRQAERVLSGQHTLLDGFEDFEALQEWSDAIVSAQDRRNGVGGCPLGSLASEVAEHDEPARQLLAGAFEQWRDLLSLGLRSMQRTGKLRSDADPDRLAVATLASLQGGLLLAQTVRSAVPLRAALDAALEHLRTYSASSPDERAKL